MSTDNKSVRDPCGSSWANDPLEVGLEAGKLRELVAVTEFDSDLGRRGGKIGVGGGGVSRDALSEIFAEIAASKPENGDVVIPRREEPRIEESRVDLEREFGNILLGRKDGGRPKSQALLTTRSFLGDHLVSVSVKTVGVGRGLPGVELRIFPRRIVGAHPIVPR